MGKTQIVFLRSLFYNPAMARKLMWFGLLMFLGLATGNIAVAIGEQVPTDIGGIPKGPQTGNQFVDLLQNTTDWLFVVVLIGAVIFIVWAGWQFISAGGEPQAVSQARSKLLYAAIGIGVAVLARGIIAAIRNIIGGAP